MIGGACLFGMISLLFSRMILVRTYGQISPLTELPPKYKLLIPEDSTYE
jgi:hypothetical protein